MINDGRRFFGLLLAMLLFATGHGCGSASMDGDLVPADDEIVDDPGRLELEVDGLPSGTDADVTITTPDGKELSASGGGLLENLQPGDYTVDAAAVLGTDGFGYRPDPASQTIVVEPGATAVASVGYLASSGSLVVAVQGLSPAAEADLRVTGPNGFRVDLSEQTTVLTELEPGSYTVTMVDVASDDAEFVPQAPLSQSMFVNHGSAQTINMSYLCTRVFIGDPEVEAELRQAIDKSEGDFNCEDLAEVRSLNIYDQVETLVGVQHLRNLESLRVLLGADPEDGIDDLEPLRHLTALTVLMLPSNNLSDLEPLSALENLRRLSLDGTATPLDDLTPLESLGSLVELDLSYAGLTAETIAPLAALTQLELLRIHGNALGDLGALATLTNLKTLNIASSQISDLRPLAGMSQMESLFLAHNQISDLEPLSGMTKLKTLHVNGNPVTGLTALEGKTELEVLYLFDAEVNDVSIRSLAGLTKLRTLFLQDASVSDIAPLGTLTSLEWLELGGTAVSDLSPLAKLEKLTRLNVSNTALASLDGVGELRFLTRLSASGNDLTDLSALAGLERLAELTLRDNAISDLRPLKELSELRLLHLHNNFVSDLSPLVDGKALDDGSTVRLHCNKLDLSPGSDSVADIAALEADGVNVHEGVQRPDPSCD